MSCESGAIVRSGNGVWSAVGSVDAAGGPTATIGDEEARRDLRAESPGERAQPRVGFEVERCLEGIAVVVVKDDPQLLGVGQAGAADFGRWYLEGVSFGVGGQTGDGQEVELRRVTGERQHGGERDGTRLAAFGLSGIRLPTPKVGIAPDVAGLGITHRIQ